MKPVAIVFASLTFIVLANGLREMLDYLRDPKRILQEECKVACRIS